MSEPFEPLDEDRGPPFAIFGGLTFPEALDANTLAGGTIDACGQPVETVPCPRCGAPAEVVQVPHDALAHSLCAAGHDHALAPPVLAHLRETT